MDTHAENTQEPVQVPRPAKTRRRVVRAAVTGVLLAGLAGTAGFAYVGQLTGNEASSTRSYDQRHDWTEHGTMLSPGAGPSTLSPGAGPSTQSATAEPTDATDAQEVGLAYINTTLDYGAGKAAGTGMILTSDGEVLTNHHVVEGATSIKVEVVSTGKTYTADVVGYDATNDIAVLRLRGATGLDTVTVDSTSTVQVGDTIVGVGNAGGDGGAASAAEGTVTALDQEITVGSESGGASETLKGLIRVDAAIISGDSGGPLYDDDGEVIGMDTAASSGSAAAVGYAIPIGTALTIADRITGGQEGGTVQIGYPAFLGVKLAGSDPGGAGGGAVIAGTIDGTPAASAGMAAGDTITTLGQASIASAADLSAAVAAHEPGQSVQVTWVDASGSGHKAAVTLGEGPVG